MKFVIAFEQGAGINKNDDAAEAYYRLKGPDKTWQVASRWQNENDIAHATIVYDGIATKDVAKGTKHDLGWPFMPNTFGGEAMQWVLTGNESYGYWSSANPPVAWMHSILDVIGPRKLKYICMPGSHDAGMSGTDGKTVVANAGNTQTQFLDIYGPASARLSVSRYPTVPWK
jgi:hypothetical protein